ncbi:CsbD family protein [Planococcus sp. APC 4015]|nr:CsbD family protein [Planococcus sp. APC 4015]
MGLDDKIKNAAQDVAGKAKEALGKATDNDKLVAEGKADQTKATVKKTGENVKDTLTGDK